MSDFERGLAAALRREEQHLDADTLARIAAARQRALAATPVAWYRRGFAPAIGAAVLASALGVAVLLPSGPLSGPGQSTTRQGDLVENPELYRNLDFYLWLAESDMGRHG